jgi:hypothetical protein
MIKRGLYIIVFLLIVPLFSLELTAQQPSVYVIKKMSFNSNEFSEISPVIVQDGIIFCSNRRFSGVTDRTGFDGRRLYNIYSAVKKDTAEWYKPNEVKSDRNKLFNSGPLCIAPDRKTVYFTSEVETGKIAKRKNFKNHNGIFIADFSDNELKNLRPFKYNNPQYNVAQPSISRDGKYLFFVSDMPGGQGGSDIYSCEFVNGEWTVPVSLGPKVNSAAIDNYPYMHPSGKLYFTSNRQGGVGNLDVYYTYLTNGIWEDPVLLPEPINSTSDDFAFVAEDDLQTGYFSSNRFRSDDILAFRSTIIRKASCNALEVNNYCYRFLEENAVKFDTLPFRYEWRFGDGKKDHGAVVEHCYKSPGTYVVQLDVVNLVTKEVMYNEKTDTLVITDVEQPYISVPDRINTGQNIMMSADSTNLPGWNIARYYWNFGDETVGLGKETPKTYLKPGTYNIQLIVYEEPQPGGIVREACVSKNIIIVRQP